MQAAGRVTRPSGRCGWAGWVTAARWFGDGDADCERRMAIRDVCGVLRRSVHLCTVFDNV